MFYEDHYRLVRDACYRMLIHGIRYDLAAAKAKAKDLDARKEAIKNEIEAAFGIQLWAESRHRSPKYVGLLERKRQLKDEHKAIPKELKAERKAKLAEVKALDAEVKALPDSARVVVERGTGLSDQRIASYLYRDLGVPAHRKKRKDTGKVTETVDDVTLKKIKQQRPDLGPLLDLVLEHRKCLKLLGYLDDEKIDDDGRIRSFFKTYGTQTGRLSSSENPLGTGSNLQNFDRSLKYLLIPDEG